jgi:hypothetical protein
LEIITGALSVAEPSDSVKLFTLVTGWVASIDNESVVWVPTISGTDPWTPATPSAGTWSDVAAGADDWEPAGATASTWTPLVPT